MQKVCQNELLLLLQKQIFKLIIFYLAKVKAQILSNKLEKSKVCSKLILISCWESIFYNIS